MRYKSKTERLIFLGPALFGVGAGINLGKIDAIESFQYISTVSALVMVAGLLLFALSMQKLTSKL